jgi:hypothetical protein
MATGLGVDFSPRYQANTPIPPGTEYAWIKVAEGGAPYRTVAPDAMVRRFKVAGIPIGGYSYAQPGDGAAHARVLLAEIRRLGALNLVPVTDIESDANIHTWSTAEATAYGRAFCREVRAQGLRPGIYMNDSMAGATRPDLWPEVPILWIARYGAKPRLIPRYDIHQFTDKPVDQNQSYTNAHFLGVDTPNTETDTDMTPEQDKQLRLNTVAIWGRANLPDGIEDRPEEDALVAVPARLTKLEEAIAKLGETAPTGPAILDYPALAKALVAELKA